MIRIENVDTYGWEPAIRGARNPMNSWDKSDTAFWCYPEEGVAHKLGLNDLRLLQNLANAGQDHGKFLRMITVTLDITAPLYWWKEFDTYKVGTVANSCSTMHKIHSRDLTVDDFSHDHNNVPGWLEYTVGVLNACRERYLETKDKSWWYTMIQVLPTSYNQRRTVSLNYAVLRTMYHARKNHKLDEWREFCRWVESLPYATELIIGGNHNEKN